MRVFNAIPFVLQTLSWIPTRIVYALRWNFTVRGENNIRDLDRSRGVIFAANHITTHDPIAIRAALPLFSSPLYYVALESKEYRHLPYLRHIAGGLFFKFWGAYPVFRGVGDYIRALSYHVGILEDGHLLCMFPHGGLRNPAPRPGIGFLASHTNALIVPTHLHKDAKKTMYVTFGIAFRFSDLGIPYEESKETYHKISHAIMRRVDELGSHENEI